MFIHAVFWIWRTGAPWRDLPPDYGDWKNVHHRFCRWRDKSIWKMILEKLAQETDCKLIAINSSYIKVHLHGVEAREGNQDMGRTKEGLTQSCILL